ncbi:MAG: class I SAM-dependent methyltransferase [Candidatus Hodarchaeales archaeon]
MTELELNNDDFYRIKPQIIDLSTFSCRQGWVLDIGGGGEGVIGHLLGKRVIAIDKSREELEETQNESLKIIMDARNLLFLDNVFQTITMFFTLMFLQENEIEIVFNEISRVLIKEGDLFIWDITIEDNEIAGKKYVQLPLTVILPYGKRIMTGYGTKAKKQNIEDFINLATKHQLALLEKSKNDKTFSLHFRKE